MASADGDTTKGLYDENLIPDSLRQALADVTRAEEAANAGSHGGRLEMNIWRSVLGVITGLIAWSIVFYAMAFGLAALWPEYGVHGREFFATGAFTFTAPMAA